MKQKLNQKRAPFLEELINYAKLNRIGFHTPGHRGGRSLGYYWKSSDILNLDLTEITGLRWDEALEEAMLTAADFYKADYSFFLVQGASQGIISAILGCFKPGDTVLVARNCHISVINGLILAGVKPIFVRTDFLPGWGISTGVNIEALQKAVNDFPDFKGLIVTNPTYQGVAERINVFRQIIGERILLVDEAHGGYFEWSGFLGYDAYEAADVWIQGTHKFLGSVTQTAMLHLNNIRVDVTDIRRSLDLVTTTSQSFLLLAALDDNRRYLANEGKALFAKKLNLVEKLKTELSDLKGLQILSVDSFVKQNKVIDPWKLVISGWKNGFSGYQIEKILQSEYQIQVEYADLYQVTGFLAPWQEESDLYKLESAIKELANRSLKATLEEKMFSELPSIPSQILNPREAMFAPGVELLFEEAIGRISACAITPYPPGIPLVVPGELICQADIDMIEKMIACGGRVNGIDCNRKLIRCVEGS